MKTIGDRLSVFDNLSEQTVKAFNDLFKEVPLTIYKDTDIVVVGEITANATTRQILINNIAIEHSFVRRTASENDYIERDTTDNTVTDPDWLFYFV